MDYNREILIRLFEDNGVFINLNDFDETLEMDSITFITLVVDVENVFGIEIPENYLIYNEQFTFKTLEDIIVEITSSQGNVQ